MPDPYRQEVLNVVLAQLLLQRGVVAAPENMIKLAQRRNMPDVIVDYRGLRVAMEGEVSDAPNAREKALKSARRRVEEGLSHIGISIVYPQELRNIPFDRLSTTLATSTLQVAIVTESGDTAFSPYSLEDLENALRRTYDHLTQEDVVAQAVAALDEGVERFALAMAHISARIPDVAQALGIRALPTRNASADDDDDAGSGDAPATENFSPEQRGAVSRVAALVLINAMIFQEVLSLHNKQVKSLQKSVTKDRILADVLIEHWEEIYTNIDYWPIFHVSWDVLRCLPADFDLTRAIDHLSQTARKIVSNRAALHHDLMGRVYHRLLADAKYLGTYYTSIPAATLLLKLAIQPRLWDVDWHDVEAVRKVKIADLACGTGTLLNAAAEAITDNHILSAVTQAVPPEFGKLQNALAEEVLHGYDVLPTAIHLTASTLALRSPETVFRKMNLFSLPMGGPELRLGSIEFLDNWSVQIPMDFTGGARQVQGKGEATTYDAKLPDLDLCVMNPPFVRSVGGNLLFGSLPDGERAAMQKKLQRLVNKPGILASSTAGLGSVFVAAAHMHIKEGGKLVLILPKALLSGVAWAETRELINRDYQIEYLIASQDPARWNFSESTSLSEAMLIASKRVTPTTTPEKVAYAAGYYRRHGANGEAGRSVAVKNPLKKPPEGVIALNLWRNPTTPFEALAIANALIRSEAPPSLETGQGALSIMLGKQKMGEAVQVPPKMVKRNWLLPCAFAQSDLTRAAMHLLENRVGLPGIAETYPIPLCPLGDLGTLGPDQRDIHDGFNVVEHVTAYPAFWGHDSNAVLTIAQRPNRYLEPLAHAKKSRPLRRSTDLWPLASPLLLCERFRLNTQRLMAVQLDQPVLANTWWTCALKNRNPQIEKALALWTNSTLGVLIQLANRVETEGAWVKFKKPTWLALPVLDVRRLSPAQLDALATAYDRLATMELQPFPHMATDPARAAIDAALAEALHLPDFSVLRRLLAQEPVVCLQRL